jgi:opacity protein-like surface antigen
MPFLYGMKPYFLRFLTLLSIAVPSSLHAQTEVTPLPAKVRPSFENGDIFITAGFGFGNLLVATFEASGLNNDVIEKRTTTGPLFFKFEQALSDNVGFGVNFALLSLKNEWTDAVDPSIYGTGRYTGWSGLARVNYHFKPGKFFDPYMGFGMGYRNDKVTETSTDPNNPRFDTQVTDIPINLGMDLTLGFRMMFSENLGIYMETGLAKGVVQLGLSARI